MSAGSWRSEDDALVQRLEDELVLDALWHHHTGRARQRTPSARAAGMIALVRKLRGGSDAVRTALEGELRPLRALLEPEHFRDLEPELVHHVALFFGSVADALEASAPDSASHVRVRALAAWLWLAEQKTYLASLAREVLGPTTSTDLDRAMEELPLSPIESLGRRATEGARDLSNGARAATRALAQTHQACRIASLSRPVAERAERLAERHRTAAMEEALASIREALESAAAANELGDRGPKTIARAVSVWRWADQDEAVEQFVVDQAAPVLWELYRAERWSDMRALLEPVRPLVDGLAARVERDPSRVAYAAAVATMYVFYVDVEPTLAGQIALAERAVRVCPSHRNGRFCLAGLLCEQAIRILEAGPFVIGSEIARAKAMIARAEELNPSSKELARARSSLRGR